MAATSRFFGERNSWRLFMAEIRETHVVKERGGNGATPWLAFIVGALLIAVIAVFLLNAHGRVSGPSGSVDLNIKSPVTTTAPASAPAR
jgi:hypothetical protein